MVAAIQRKNAFVFIQPATGLKVDFWLSGEDDFDRSRFKRKITKTVLGETVYFTSPEDLILIKLIWYKESGLARHLEDA